MGIHANHESKPINSFHAHTHVEQFYVVVLCDRESRGISTVKNTSTRQLGAVRQTCKSKMGEGVFAMTI